jgi:hypothetical protein
MYQSYAKIEAPGLNFDPFVETEAPAGPFLGSDVATVRRGVR